MYLPHLVIADDFIDTVLKWQHRCIALWSIHQG